MFAISVLHILSITRFPLSNARTAFSSSDIRPEVFGFLSNDIDSIEKRSKERRDIDCAISPRARALGLGKMEENGNEKYECLYAKCILCTTAKL